MKFEGEWIPVAKRLPDTNINVLASFDGGLVAECFFDSHGWWDVTHDPAPGIPVAWAEMPAPYEPHQAPQTTDDDQRYLSVVCEAPRASVGAREARLDYEADRLHDANCPCRRCA